MVLTAAVSVVEVIFSGQGSLLFKNSYFEFGNSLFSAGRVGGEAIGDKRDGEGRLAGDGEMAGLVNSKHDKQTLM